MKKLLLEEQIVHKVPAVGTKRPAFHFPTSVLTFLQEEYGSQLDISPVITPSTTFDDDDDDDDSSHGSLEKRQPDFLQKQTKHFLVDEDEQRDVEQRHLFHSGEDTTLGSTCHDEETILQSSSMRNCIDLLSSHDLDLNRVGLQRLSLLTQGRTLFGLHRSETLIVSMSLVYGGQMGSLQDQLQHALSNMICDDITPHHHDTNIQQRLHSVTEGIDDNDNVIDFDILDRIVNGQWNQEDVELEGYNSCDEEESITSNESHADDFPEGKAFGALHLQGLKILTNAMIEVTNINLYGRDVSNELAASVASHKTIPLNCRIWKNIVHSLVHNIESNHTANITGYSLKILRLLYTIHPDMIQPLLQQTLFPYLMYLQTYGQDHLFPIIHSESTYLIRRAKYLW
ncbi:hypothetical protein IV203_007846 [Nitzschia inconspicua]|uniref:Uncharacterized protein n=1 Tax=Nitzschia inconspicua TaxID=303405 RepID=A0A9K3KZ02_9STRA|nr:hypothetical protein IV203_007846 [Nitzschia inconspicua]